MIRPALTPEEWAICGVAREGLNAWALTGDLTIGELSTRNAAGTPRLGFDVEDEDRHALAALCLHGQPFGFTREDVDLLRQAANDAEWEARPYPEGVAEARKPFDSLADRIEALLPPESDHRG